jgi:acyl-coenzyme A thioesterase PaaI-like protein
VARDELAAVVRRLMELTVTADAGPEVLAAAAARLGAVADELAPTVLPEGESPRVRFADRTLRSEEASTLAEAMPFDMIIGSCNPLAPPIVMHMEPPVAVGHVVFGHCYEGAPGLVHGAALAAAFDIILTGANVLADGAGPTVTLDIRYRRPSRIGVPSRFEAWVTDQTDRRTHSTGRLLQDGVVTVEADGVFVNMTRDRVRTLYREGRPDRRADRADRADRAAEEAT